MAREVSLGGAGADALAPEFREAGDPRPGIRAFLSRFCRGGAISDQQDVFASGFVNSMVAMQLVLFVEKRFGITVAEEDLDLDNFRSVDAIAGLVNRKRHV